MTTRDEEQAKQVAMKEVRRLKMLALGIRRKIHRYKDTNPALAQRADELANAYEESATKIEDEFLEGERVDVD